MLKFLWLQPTPLERIVAGEIYAAERELLEAQASFEYWDARAKMLRSRLVRLKLPNGVTPTLFEPNEDFP
jgi:hypothetical protein